MVRISRSISPHAAKANAKADTRGRSSLVPARRVHGPRCSRVKGAAARRHEERDSVRTSAARCAIIVMGITRGWTGGEVALFAGQPPCETCSAPKRAKHARRTNRQARSLRPQASDPRCVAFTISPALEPEERERSCERAREASKLRAPGRTSYSTRDQQLGGRANRFASHALPQCRVCYLCMGLAVPASRPAPATPDAGTPHPK